MSSSQHYAYRYLKISLRKALWALGQFDGDNGFTPKVPDNHFSLSPMPEFEDGCSDDELNAPPATTPEVELRLELLAALAKASGEGICLVNGDGNITFVSDAIMRVLGYRSSELVGKNLHDTIHARLVNSRQHSPDQCPLIDVLRNGKRLKNREELLLRKDGTQVEVACSSAPIMIKGRIIGCVITFHDITDRRAEEQFLANTIQSSRRTYSLLQKETERMHVIAEMSSRALKQGDSSALMQNLLNRATETLHVQYGCIARFTGKTGNEITLQAVAGFPAELRGRSFPVEPGSLEAEALDSTAPLIIPDFGNDERSRPSGLQAEYGIASVAQVVISTLEKPVGLLRVESRAPRHFEREEIQFLQTLANILASAMEARLLEVARPENQCRYYSMIQEAVVGIGQTGSDGRWLDANRKFCDIVGYSLQELKRLTFQDITHPDDWEREFSLYQKLLSREIDCYRMGKRYIASNGDPVWVSLTASSVTPENGPVQYVLLVVHDINDHHCLTETATLTENPCNQPAYLAQAVYEGLQGLLRDSETLCFDLGETLNDGHLRPVLTGYLDRSQLALKRLLTAMDELLSAIR